MRIILGSVQKLYRNFWPADRVDRAKGFLVFILCEANWSFSLISPLILICWEAQTSNWCDKIINISLEKKFYATKECKQSKKHFG